uniref:Plasma membrane calcium-transporting ATPase 1-like n=1 Tax=Rhipicephalus zambeziensis TaxID=60191 RepID=A0A224YJ34_9ACAR
MSTHSRSHSPPLTLMSTHSRSHSRLLPLVGTHLRSYSRLLTLLGAHSRSHSRPLTLMSTHSYSTHHVQMSVSECELSALMSECAELFSPCFSVRHTYSRS